MRRVIMVPGFCALLFSLMWLLVSCTPTQPNETTVSSELTPTAESAMANSFACKETVIQSDLDSVLKKPELNNQLVYWTWHMNFLEFADPLTKRQPLSCFRLYARAEEGGPFQEVDQGGFVITGCEVTPGVTFDTVTRTYAIRGNKVLPSPGISTGRATFANGGYIRCGNFSITELVKQVIHDPQEYEVTAFMSEALSQVGDTQVYSSFTMIATGYVSNTQPVTQAVNPLLHYHPTSDDQTIIDRSSITFALPSIELPRVKFSAQLNGSQYDPSDLISSTCEFPSQEEHFWWMDFTGYRDEVKRLLFLKHKVVDDLSDPINFDACISIDRVSPDTPPPSEITFWTGPSEIYIGCEWNPVSECDSTFNGVLYSVLIDPLDSKPQSLISP